MNIKGLVREDIRDLQPYEPHLYENVIKLDANENPYPFPEELKNKIFAAVGGETFTRYPDPTADELRREIAKLTGVGYREIICGNGSDELIQLILQTFAGPGRRVLIPIPTFAMYHIHSRITGSTPVHMPMDETYCVPVETIISEMAHPDTRVTFLVTPNNPTGSTIPLDTIEYILERSAGLVVVDEAYIDFGGYTALPLLAKYNNLVILRTFSKVGMGGLRIGYLLAGREVVDELMKVRQPYNTDAFSQLAATVALRNWPLIMEQVEKIVAERGRLMSEMAGLPGMTVYPSAANFILFKPRQPAGEVHQRLLDAGILVRNLGSAPGLANCLRVTVGQKEENDGFLANLRDILR
jgi:histidinol-phosphate aminotransferase